MPLIELFDDYKALVAKQKAEIELLTAQRDAAVEELAASRKAVPLWQQAAKAACDALQARNDKLTRRLNERTHR